MAGKLDDYGVQVQESASCIHILHFPSAPSSVAPRSSFAPSDRPACLKYEKLAVHGPSSPAIVTSYTAPGPNAVDSTCQGIPDELMQTLRCLGAIGSNNGPSERVRWVSCLTLMSAVLAS